MSPYRARSPHPAAPGNTPGKSLEGADQPLSSTPTTPISSTTDLFRPERLDDTFALVGDDRAGMHLVERMAESLMADWPAAFAAMRADVEAARWASLASRCHRLRARARMLGLEHHCGLLAGIERGLVSWTGTGAAAERCRSHLDQLERGHEAACRQLQVHLQELAGVGHV